MGGDGRPSSVILSILDVVSRVDQVTSGLLLGLHNGTGGFRDRLGCLLLRFRYILSGLGSRLSSLLARFSNRPGRLRRRLSSVGLRLRQALLSLRHGVLGIRHPRVGSDHDVAALHTLGLRLSVLSAGLDTRLSGIV